MKNIGKKQVNVSEKTFSIDAFEKYDYVIFLFYTITLLIINLINHKIGDYGVETDFFWMYVPEAKKILSGTLPIDQFRGPFYPIVLAIFKFIIGDFFKAGIVINTISAGLTLYLLDKILKNYFSKFVAFFTTVFVAFNPVFIQYSYSCGTDILFLALIMSSIYFFVSENKYNLIFSGIFAGFAYLTRYNGIFLILATLLTLLINFILEKDYKSFVKKISLYLIPFIIVILPWGLYTKSEKGEFFYNQNYLNTAYEFQQNKVSWDEYWQSHKDIHSIWDIFSSSPSYFIEKVFSNLYRNYVLDIHRLLFATDVDEALKFNEQNLSINLLHIVILLSLGLLLIKTLIPSEPNKLKEKFNFYSFRLYLLLNFILYAIILTLIFYSERFNLFLIPFYGLAVFFTLEKITSKAKFAGIVLSSILVIYIAQASYNYNEKQISIGPEEVLQAAEWINNNNLPKTKIIARKPHIAYYTDMKFEVIPVFNSIEDLTKKLVETDADYIFISNMELSSRPFFQEIMTKENLSRFPMLSQKLEIIYSNEYPLFIIYKIKK